MSGGPEVIPWMVLARVSLLTVPMPGATVSKANCGHNVWMSPSGAAFLAGEGSGAYTQCTTCYDKESFDEEDSVGTVPGAAAELNNLGINQADLDWLTEQIKKGRRFGP